MLPGNQGPLLGFLVSLIKKKKKVRVELIGTILLDLKKKSQDRKGEKSQLPPGGSNGAERKKPCY